mgnify:CR=1 FL=1
MAVLESDSEHESRDESGMPEQAPGSGLTASSAEQHDREVDEAIAQDELDDAQLDDTLSPDHYDARDLKVLEGLEAVRIRPGMYIGSTGPRGLHHLVYEIVDNSVDEALAGYATHIEVTILPDNGIRVVDDGRGIPVDEVPGEGVSGVETVMTKLHAGGKFGGGGYAVSGGLHGVGISVVNALSTRVDIEVRRQGFHWTQTYVNQHPTARLAKGAPMAEDESTGTSVTFWPDAAIFESTVYDFETLRSRFQQMAFLNKGLKISLTDLREPDLAGDEVAGDDDSTEPKHQSVTYQYMNGIKDYVSYLVKSRKATPVEEDVIDFEAEDLKIGISAEVAMQWTTAYSEAVHTFANTISTTEGGTHEEGFRAALTSLVNRYARDKNILKEKDDNLSGDDVREGLTAVVSVKLTTPQFEGQTKTKLGSKDIRPDGPTVRNFIMDFVTRELDNYLHRNPDTAELLLRKIVETEKERKAMSGVQKIARERAKQVSLHNRKLRDCRVHFNSNHERKNESSIFITEGDSASGSITKSRDVNTQAVFSLRGKPLNSYGLTKEIVYKNEEFNLLQAALNIEDGLEELRYNNVIVATDADVDGMHIRLLLLTFFLQFFPDLVRAGHVYILQTPLFRVRNKKETRYCYSDAERENAIQKLGPKPEITRFKGLGEISPNEFVHFIGKDIRLEPVRLSKGDSIDEVLSYYMGKNTPERQDFIIDNLYIEKDELR